MAQPLSSPTLERLIRDIRIILNQPREENSRWSNVELGEYINDAVRQYFLVLNEQAEGQFDISSDLNLVQGQEEITLPSDFFTIKALYRKNDDNTFTILQYRNNVVSSYDGNTNTGSTAYYPYYYFRGNKIVLRPIPGFSQTAGLKIEYTAFPETLLTGDDILTSGIAPVFKELVVMYGVYKAKMKDDLVNNSNTSEKAAAHLANLYNNFKHQVAERAKYPLSVTPYNPEGSF